MQEFLVAHPFYTLIIAGVGVYWIRKRVINFNKITTGSTMNDNNDIPKPKKSVKLFGAEGTLLQEYNDVYVEYEDTNIYLLSREYEGRCFLRIEKGANMLLIVTCYAESKEDAIKNV